MSKNRSASFSVSAIDVSLAKKSWKRVESIKLNTKGGGLLKDIETTLRAGDTYRDTFEPPLVVKSDDHILVSTGYGYIGLWKRYDVVQVDIDLQDTECIHEERGIISYRKMTGDVEVMVQVAGYPPILPQPSPVPPVPISTHSAPGLIHEELVPTTDDLIRECAKFRVLVIGNSGVGKSTLIRKMFGVEDVHISDAVRGKADINQEFTSRENNRFVVHDSVGFEAGDEGRMETVKDFVKRRQAMDRLEDQLHAIWLCVEIPHSGGRLVDAGVEQFLKHQHKITGNIPLIVVLTKMDLLDVRLDLEAQDKEPLESRRTKHLEKHCIAPLRKAAGQNVICIAVCAMEGYYMPISNLLQATKEDMAKHAIHEAPRAMASIAQRVDMKAKIETSLSIGKKKHWQNLQKSRYFGGRTLKECLEVIRKDIVTVWNLNGLSDCLTDDRLILALVPADVFGDLGISQPTVPLRDLLAKMADEGFLAAVKDKFSSVIADFLHRPYDKYQETIHGVEIFVCYIVNLICVIQVIFLLALDSRVTRDIVDCGIKACKDKREQVHASIKGFAEKRPLRTLKQDEVLREIGELISRYSLSGAEVEKLRQDVPKGATK